MNFKNTILPLLAVIALCIGNFLRLTEVEVVTLEQSLFAIATAVATLVGMYGVYKDNHKKDSEK